MGSKILAWFVLAIAYIQEQVEIRIKNQWPRLFPLLTGNYTALYLVNGQIRWSFVTLKKWKLALLLLLLKPVLTGYLELWLIYLKAEEVEWLLLLANAHLSNQDSRHMILDCGHLWKSKLSRDTLLLIKNAFLHITHMPHLNLLVLALSCLKCPYIIHRQLYGT